MNSKMIINEISNADKFIKEILGFTKPESLNLTLYSIYELLEDVVEKFNLLTKNKKIKIKLGKSPELPKFYFLVIR